MKDLLESAPDAMVVVNQSSTVVLVNGKAEKLFGYRREEMLGKPFEILTPERYRRRHLAHIGGFFNHPHARETGSDLELFGLRKDGSEFPAEISFSPLRTDEGTLVSSAIRDATERKRSEQATQAWLGAIVEGSEDAIIGKTLEGTITSWNRGAERLFGYRDEEMIGQPVSLLIPEDRMEEEMQILGRLGRGESIDHYETVRRHKNGRLIDISLTVSPIRDGNGRQIGASKVARDITERKRAERRLRESEERFRELAENIDEVFWLAEAELQSIIYVSPAYERIWGRSCESFYAEPQAWIDAIHPEDRERVIDERKTRSDVATELEFRIVRPDGAVRSIRDRGFPVRDAAGRVIRVAGVAEDVTERRNLDAQLQNAQKMEAIGQLAGGVAHDFNNLLLVIFGNIELLEMNLPPEDPQKEFVTQISWAAERAAALTRQLLAFSRQQVLEPRVVDLNSLVTEAEKMLRRLIGEEVRLQILLQPGLSRVRVDPGQMGQVIMNLAVNSRDAMPHGGCLIIETRGVQLDLDRAKDLLELRPGRYVLLTVSDDGCGISPEVQTHIFEPFFTTKPVGKGTGLGLPVVRGIVKQSGGHISVESAPGKGTAFKIYLPAVDESLAAKPRAPGKAVGGSEIVLLVEDEEAVRTITARMLKALGYQVLQAASGEEALRLAEERMGKIDLLMTDVVMLDMSGHELADELRRRYTGLRVLIQSGYTSDVVLRNGTRLAEEGFLQKPFRLDALAKKVREILERPCCPVP